MLRKITKEAHGKLSPELQGEYKEVAGGTHFLLIVTRESDDDGADDPALAARDREKKRAQDAEAKLKEAEDKLKALEEKKPDDKPKPSTDFEKAMTKRFEDQDKAHKEEVAKIRGERHRDLIATKALELATGISTAPKVMAELIAKRLIVEETDGGSVVRVVGDDGKVSAMTLPELSKSFVDNSDMKGMILQSLATGGSAPGSAAGGRATADLSKVSYATGSAADIIAKMEADGVAPKGD